MYIVVSYDIHDDRRRYRVARQMEDFGKRVQYSVFDCHLDEKDLGTLKRVLARIIDHETDSVRFYRLCGRCAAGIEILGSGTVQSDDQLVVL